MVLIFPDILSLLITYWKSRKELDQLSSGSKDGHAMSTGNVPSHGGSIFEADGYTDEINKSQVRYCDQK